MYWKQAQHEHDNELPSEENHCDSCEEETNLLTEKNGKMLCEYCLESYE